MCAAVAMSFASAANAETIINDWVFNPSGGGFATGQRINEYLDFNGNAFVQITPTSATTFSFREHAVFNVVQADSNGRLFPLNFPGGNISATFVGNGTGNFDGTFQFSGGTIRMYQNEVDGQYATEAGIYGANLGEEIAMFDVLAGGGGRIDASGSPLDNGQVTILAKAQVGALDAGYFYRENGRDLSQESILAFAFTNANTVSQPSGTLVSEVACQFAAYTGPGCNGSAYVDTAGGFFLSNNGQFKLAEVPEPGSLGLFGIALLGAGAVSRKRAKKV